MHAVLLLFLISFGGRTIMLGNICTKAQATFVSSLWMAFTPTFMARHTQPSSAVVQLFSLPLAGLKGCHRFAEKPNWKHDVIPTSHVPPLSLCICLSLSLSLHLPLPSIPFIYAHKSRWEVDIFNQKRKKYGSINPATPTIIMLGLCERLYLHTFVFRYTNVNVCMCVCKVWNMLMRRVTPEPFHR